MALVSISEAARLTGKSRTTVQSYIKQGKLTKCTDTNHSPKVDTSELLRVFGAFTAQQVGSNDLSINEQHLAGNFVQVSEQLLQQENQNLKSELDLIKAILREKELLLSEKDKRNEDLRQALLVIESSIDKTPGKKTWMFWKKK